MLDARCPVYGMGNVRSNQATAMHVELLVLACLLRVLEILRFGRVSETAASRHIFRNICSWATQTDLLVAKHLIVANGSVDCPFDYVSL
jgi:hypothetical protein